jgi:uncharacterized protein involved in exopolysaccharide biosynthesis
MEKNKHNEVYPPVPPNYPNYYPVEEDEIDLYEMWLTLLKRKKLIISITSFITVLAVIISLLLPKVYKTDFSLIPLGGKRASGIASLLGSLPVSLPTTTSGITVEAVLKSRILRENLVEKLNLLPILFPDNWDNVTKKWILKNKDDKPPTIFKGANALKNLISVSTDKKTGVINVSVLFKKQPEMTYKIANGIIKTTDEILNKKSFTLVKKYRVYVGERLQEAKIRLKKLEKIYIEFSEGKIKDIPFLTMNKETEFGKLQGKLIAEKEKLKAIKNSNFNISKKEVAKQQEKIKKIKNQIDEYLKKLNSMNPNFVSIPKLKFNLLQLKSEISIAQGLYQSLVHEYEMAKAQEMKEQIAFQVIDPPYVPEKRFKPKRKLIVVVAFVTGLVLSVFIVFFLEWIENIKNRDQEEI